MLIASHCNKLIFIHQLILISKSIKVKISGNNFFRVRYFAPSGPSEQGSWIWLWFWDVRSSNPVPYFVLFFYYFVLLPDWKWILALFIRIRAYTYILIQDYAYHCANEDIIMHGHDRFMNAYVHSGSNVMNYYTWSNLNQSWLGIIIWCLICAAACTILKQHACVSRRCLNMLQIHFYPGKVQLRN